MTTPRKRLPYACNGLLDQALMELADLLHTADKLSEPNLLPEERMRLLGMMVKNAYKAMIYLKEIPRQGDDDAKD